MALSGALAVWAAIRQWPWEDEFHSLYPWTFLRYRANPAFFAYLKMAWAFADDLIVLRLWSTLPFLVALPLFHSLAVRLGCNERVATLSVAFFGLNPFVLHESANLRYYAFSIMASLLAFHGAVTLRRGCGSRLTGAACWGALLLQALTVSSGGILSLMLMAWAFWRRGLIASHGPRIASVSCAILLIGLYPFRWEILGFLQGKSEAALGGFPVQVGYHRGPVDTWALGFQYEKLLGLHVWEVLCGAHWLRGLAMGLAALAVVGIQKFGRQQLGTARWVLLPIALLPVVVTGLATTIVNFLNPRYYLHVVIPFCLGLAFCWDVLWRSSRTTPIACLLAVILCVHGGRGFVVDHNPDLSPMMEVIRSHRVERIRVHPTWFAATVRDQLRFAGLKTQVEGTEILAGEPCEWVFIKEPRYIARRDGQLAPRIIDFGLPYETACAATYLPKYYFHPEDPTDRLLRLVKR